MQAVYTKHDSSHSGRLAKPFPVVQQVRCIIGYDTIRYFATYTRFLRHYTRMGAQKAGHTIRGGGAEARCETFRAGPCRVFCHFSQNLLTCFAAAAAARRSLPAPICALHVTTTTTNGALLCGWTGVTHDTRQPISQHALVSSSLHGRSSEEDHAAGLMHFPKASWLTLMFD